MSTPVIASLLVVLSAHVTRKTPTPSPSQTYTATSTVILTATPTVTLTPSNTPTSTATATPTILDTATITPTTTPASLVCPANGATLVIQVENESGVPQQVTFTGNVLTPSCFGGIGAYSSTTTCGVGVTDCLTLAGLSSGIWKHHISAGLQNQATKSILLAADPNGVANSVSWVVFSSVLTVDRTDDVSSNPNPQCPSAPGMQTCTLRKAMAAGGSVAAPLLIQFDPQVFPAGTATTIQLTQTGSLPIAGYQMTIDGKDLDGSPTFSDDAHNRVVQLPDTGGTFVFSNQRAQLIGLFLQRPPLVDGATPGDLLRFDGTVGVSSNNVVANCRIDGGGGSLTMKSTAHDCVEGFGGAGADWGSANRIQNTELTGCPDKAAKVTTLAHLVVQDSWIHHNIGGGLQATFSGNLEADRNLVEFNGYNSTAQVFMNANGLSANGANNTVQPISPSIPSVLQTNGNIIRNNSLRGISAQELSAATITNDLSCGALNGGTAGQNGIAIFNSTTDAAFAMVRGTTAAYNGRNGATVANQSTIDLGQGAPDGGNNAFTQNATNASLGGHNVDDSSTQANVPAAGNQWQHCYADPSQPSATCDGNLALDFSGSVAVSAPQPYRGDGTTLPLAVQRFVPTKAKAADVVRIIGSGFNPIDAYPAGGDCVTTPPLNNTCNPLVGNCVQYEMSPGQWADVPVLAVTPTQLVVQMPATFLCAQPVNVRVQRLDFNGNVVSTTATFCTNS